MTRLTICVYGLEMTIRSEEKKFFFIENHEKLTFIFVIIIILEHTFAENFSQWGWEGERE